MHEPAHPDVEYRGEVSPRRFSVAVLLNLLMPGLGYVYCGMTARGLAVYALFASTLAVFIGVVWGVGMFLPRAALLCVIGWLYLQVFLAGSLRGRTGARGGDYVLRGANHPIVYGALFALLVVAPGWLALELVPRYVLIDVTVTDRNAFPALLPGDRVYGGRSSALSTVPARGDLVVVTGVVPRPTVLRVIARPGDEVAIEAGVPVVNGSPLFRESLGRPAAHGPLSDPAPAELEGLSAYREFVDERGYEVFLPFGVEPDERPPLRLNADEYYLLADLRGVEQVIDSRRLGPIAAEHIEGRPLYVWWSRALDGRLRWRRVGVRLR